ncbi:hypothetical protein COW46_03775 [Candidatus Gracilibacteria bacterium CG17_big_fil_post_rev_8_21_14_2_50_48_13]|nr:MAG: hypothetical protein COW46_03775 [Candidatus Gracilibacteria bacterium CG17_big_fil_post_rev_8_21_14_2_50_48_13]
MQHQYSQLRGFVLCTMFAALFSVSGAFAQETLNRTPEDTAALTYDAILKQTDTVQEEIPLARMYGQIFDDVVTFPKQQTQLEFQRKYGVPAPTFGSALIDDTTLASTTGARQAVDKRLMEIDEEHLFARNLRFIQAYVIGKYLSVFMNGDTSDSSFDLFLDIDTVQKNISVDGASYQNLLPPRFSAGITNIARYLKGSAAQAITMDPNVRNNRINLLEDSKTITFQEEGIPVCTLPGIVQEGDVQGLDAATKKAVLGSIVDLLDAQSESAKTLDNTQLLNRVSEKSFFERFLAGEKVTLPNLSGCFNTFCARLDFIVTPPTLAAGRLSRPLPLMVSLKSIEANARTLSNTPLETKYVGRSMFSFSFFQLDFNSQIYTIGTNIEVRFVPIFQPYSAEKSFNAQAFDDLMRTYTFMQQGTLIKSDSGIVGADRGALNQLTSDALSREKIQKALDTHKATMVLRTMLYWNQNYLKVVGDRLLQLQLQVGSTSALLTKLQEEFARLNKAKTLYSK